MPDEAKGLNQGDASAQATLAEPATGSANWSCEAEGQRLAGAGSSHTRSDGVPNGPSIADRARIGLD